MACKNENFQSKYAQMVLDVSFFKKKSDFEKRKLIDLAEIAERHLELSTTPEDLQDMLRSAAGQAKLLVNEKFKQFERLIAMNMNPEPGNPSVQVEDLAGFWDLVMIEVQSLYKTFSKIAEMFKLISEKN